MSIIKLLKSEYIPVSYDTTEDEYYESMASELYLLLVSPMYSKLSSANYYYPWLLHLRQSLSYRNLEYFKRLRCFRQ